MTYRIPLRHSTTAMTLTTKPFHSIRVPILGFSGKFGAGKDTVAKAVMDQLFESWTHLSFAYALKRESSDLYVSCERDHLRPSFAYDTADGLVVPDVLEFPRPELPDGSLAPIVPHAPLPCGASLSDEEGGAVCGSVVARPVDGFARTPEVRRLLQWHGTDLRRREDPDYWVRRGLDAARASLENGSAVAFTDVRFPNEAEALAAAGGIVIRVTIDPEVQLQRLLSRDGSLPPASAWGHRSDTALDDYEDFDLVVDNSGSLEDTVARIVEFVRPLLSDAA